MQDLGATAKESGGGFNALQEIATGALRAVGEAVTGLAIKGFQMLGDAISDGIADAKQNAQIQAQTAAVIKSTGAAAGVSAQHVADYATSLSDAAGKSLFGDDQIQQSENMLLTFTNIKEKVLDAATAVSVDMAQALGGNPKDQAIALGKALNDPIKGITALTRVGVTFTDEQKAQIQAMQEAGDMAGAQTVIINELNKEFGGSAAAAAAATGGWSEFNGRMGEAKEALGAALLPLLSQFAGVLNDTVLPIVEGLAQSFGVLTADMMEAFDQGGIGAAINVFLNEVMGLNTNIGFLVDDGIALLQNALTLLSGAWADAGTFTSSFGEQLAATLDTLMGTGDEASGPLQSAFLLFSSILNDYLIPALDAVWTVLQTQVMPILSDLATALFPLVGAAIQILAGFWTDVLIPAVQMLWGILTTVLLPILAALAGWLKDNLPGAIQATADFFTNTLFPILHQIYDWISANVIPILAMLAQWLIANVPVAIQAASDFFTTVLLPAVQAIWAFINDSVFPLFATLWTWLATTVPAALQTLANFWNTILLPAINAVWAFIQNFIIPLFTALANLWIALVKKELELLTAIWTNVLLPAITNVWTFIQTKLGPIFQWLTDMVLHPLILILGDIYATVLGSVTPILTKLADLVQGAVAHAFNTLNSMAGAAAGGLSKIGQAVQGVIDWINDLVSALNSVSIPSWLQGHSPPPMADWFSYIGEAVGQVNAQLPTLAMNLAAQIGPSGQSVVNTASTRSFTYAPTVYSSGGTDMPMDLALASSLAGV